MAINRVTLTGHLTRDPELRASRSGTEILSFGIAVNERVRDPSTGEWGDRANFFDCAMFGRRASAVSRYLARGSKVAVEGRLRYSSWERDGERRSRVEVVVDEIELMTRGRDQAEVPDGALRLREDGGVEPLDVYAEDVPF